MLIGEAKVLNQNDSISDISNPSQSIPNYQIGMRMVDNEIEDKNNDSESGTEYD